MRPLLCLLALLCAILPAHAQEQCSKSTVGLVTLALENKRFPVGKAIEVLRASKNPSFAFVDKAFGNQTANIQRLIHGLDSNPINPTNCLTVIVYGDCGPCRFPRRPKGLFHLIADGYDIRALNRALVGGNRSVLNEHNQAYLRIKAYLPQVPNLRYIFMPQLEDNLNQSSYAVLRSLALQVFGDRPDVTIGRNPVGAASFRGTLEQHSFSADTLHRLKPGDVVTADGVQICFPGERCDGYTLEETARIIKEAERRDINILLWRPENQGLSFLPHPYQPPSSRSYKFTGLGYLRHLLGE